MCRASEGAGTSGSTADAGAIEAELQRLRAENEGLRDALALLATSCMPDELKEGAHFCCILRSVGISGRGMLICSRALALSAFSLNNKRIADLVFAPSPASSSSAATSAAPAGEAATADGPSSSSAPSAAKPASGKAGNKPTELSASAKAVDGSYFDSYGGFGIHQDMISDKVCVCWFVGAGFGCAGSPLGVLTSGREALNP